MPCPVELVIFDCDGVLVDSEIIGITLTRELLAKHGVNVSFAEYCAEYCGLRWESLVEKVHARSGVRLPDGLYPQFYAALLAALRSRLTRIAGSLEVVSALTLPVCIGSNSPAAQLELMLKRVGLHERFAGAIYSAVDLGPGRGKPQPDIFLHAAACQRVAAARALVIEDSVHGVMAAKRAGMRVVGFTGGAHSWPQHGEQLQAAGADWLMASMTDLPAILDRLV